MKRSSLRIYGARSECGRRGSGYESVRQGYRRRRVHGRIVVDKRVGYNHPSAAEPPCALFRFSGGTPTTWMDWGNCQQRLCRLRSFIRRPGGHRSGGVTKRVPNIEVLFRLLAPFTIKDGKLVREVQSDIGALK